MDKKASIGTKGWNKRSHNSYVHCSAMSSKPICYWITQAPMHQLVHKVQTLVTEIVSDRKRFGYNLAADVLDKYAGTAYASRTLTLGLLLALLLTHPGFFAETQAVEDPALFEAYVEYLRQRFFDLMSARVQHLSELTYDVAWFIFSRQDPHGFSHRRHGKPMPKNFPTRKVMRLDLSPANSP